MISIKSNVFGNIIRISCPQFHFAAGFSAALGRMNAALTVHRPALARKAQVLQDARELYVNQAAQS